MGKPLDAEMIKDLLAPKPKAAQKTATTSIALPPGRGPTRQSPDPNCSEYFAGSGWECFDRFQYAPTDPISASWKNLAPAADNHCNQPAGNANIAGDIELVNFEQYSVSKLRLSCVDAANHALGTTC